MKKPEYYGVYTEWAAAIYILVFAYTAISKLKEPASFYRSLSQVPFLKPYAAFLTGFVPGLEIAIVICLLVPVTRRWGLYLAVVLMILFTGYVAIILYAMKKLPCSCGGIISSLGWRQHLVLNILLLLAGLVSIILDKKHIAINRRSRIPVK